MAQKADSKKRFFTRLGAGSQENGRAIGDDEVKPSMARRGPGARLSHLVAVLSSSDDQILMQAADLLRTELGGLMVIAAPDSKLLKANNSDIGVFLGDTSVESQAELCIQRTIQQFGRVDLLISVVPERVRTDGLSYTIAYSESQNVESQEFIEDGDEAEMRMGEFDHLLYSKIRSIYLLSRFVRRAKLNSGRTNSKVADQSAAELSSDTRLDFVLARLEIEKRSDVSALSPRQAVLSAVRSWMEKYARGSRGGVWLEILNLNDLVISLSREKPMSSFNRPQVPRHQSADSLI